MPTLPPNVVLYIPTRSAPKCFVHMKVTYPSDIDTNAVAMTRAEELHCTFNMPPAPSKGLALSFNSVKDHAGQFKKKHIKAHPDIVIMNDANLLPIPVISISAHTSIFAWESLIPNIIFSNASTTVPSVPPVPAAPSIPKPRAPKTPMGLSPHVAKLLLDLATIKKEQCPITMEEFTAGNTAAMPCGHLFVKMALEETFKKEPNKCPWCRQKGDATFV